MKKNIFILLILVSILNIFSFSNFASKTNNEKDYINGNLPTLIKKVKPSIVVIFTYSGKFDIALKKEKKEENILSLGSGFFISHNGDIITNYHVLDGAASAEIMTSDGKTYTISDVVSGDEQNDIIRLSVNMPSENVYPLSLNKALPEVGERIIVYGSPLGLENTVSDGIVSAIRDIPEYGRIIQITAPVSPGSSGSPVLNMKGEVIGMATFQIIEGQNLNFAIPGERIAELTLSEENEAAAIEEFFAQKSRSEEVIPIGDETQIRSVINDFFWALGDCNWDKAKSFTVYNSKMYDTVCGLESGYNIMSSQSGNIIIIDTQVEDILKVTINGDHAKAYCFYGLSIFVYDNNYNKDKNYGYGFLNLQKINNIWYLTSIGL